MYAHMMAKAQCSCRSVWLLGQLAYMQDIVQLGHCCKVVEW